MEQYDYIRLFVSYSLISKKTVFFYFHKFTTNDEKNLVTKNNLFGKALAGWNGSLVLPFSHKKKIFETK
ncbi:hypothetical protein BpHYR1_050518 [Brachionus plicatilis]|uniref:Uncharacterized protein n=1 Tax=Brachionus plicatilis TaxID=10195 RepID=A0A3M7P8L5_BRAPC|nr:hypothetical protein BpHYR1_050518 [Brachionus plicatilis]